MKRETRQSVQRLTRMQWRRLCLAQLWEQAVPPSGWAALVCLSAGLIHQGIRDIDPFAPVIFAIVPGFLYLVLALRRLPGLSEAAALVDRQLQAESLFISVWELASARGGVAAVAPLLIARVEQRLPWWRKQMMDLPFPRPGALLLFICSLITLGGFLLLLPGHPVSLPRPTHMPESRHHQAYQTPDPTSLIKELRQQQLQQRAEVQAAFSTAMPAAAETIAAPVPKADSAAMQQGEDELQRPATEFVKQAQTSSVTASDRIDDNMATMSHNTTRDHSANAPGTEPADPRTAPITRASDSLQTQRSEFSIPGISEDKSYNTQKAGRLIVTIGERSPQSRRQAVAAIATQLSLRNLSPQQRALVQGYFEQLSQIDERRP